MALSMVTRGLVQADYMHCSNLVFFLYNSNLKYNANERPRLLKGVSSVIISCLFQKWTCCFYQHYPPRNTRLPPDLGSLIDWEALCWWWRCWCEKGLLLILRLCSGVGVRSGGGRRIQRTLLQTRRSRKFPFISSHDHLWHHHTWGDGSSGDQVFADLQVSSCEVFPVVFQDMEISAVELRTIMNKIVAKRKLKLKPRPFARPPC